MTQPLPKQRSTDRINGRGRVTGNPALGLGNAVGSKIANVGMTLGAAALAAPRRVRWRSLAPRLLCLMLGTVAVIAAGWDGTLSRFEGVLLLVAFVGVLAACIGRTRKEKPELQDAIAAFARTSTGLGPILLRFAIAVVRR